MVQIKFAVKAITVSTQKALLISFKILFGKVNTDRQWGQWGQEAKTLTI